MLTTYVVGHPGSKYILMFMKLHMTISSSERSFIFSTFPKGPKYPYGESLPKP